MPIPAIRALASGVFAAAVLTACTTHEEAPAPAAQTPPPTTVAAKKVPNVHAFTIGELSAYALRDGTIEFPNDNKIFGVGRTAEETSALLAASGLPTDTLHFSVQPLLVKTADKVLLFDTGAAGSFGPGTGLLPGALAEAGVDPAKVTDVFISHLHGDHVGGLIDAQGALAFPNATIHIQKAEWTFLQEVKEDMAKAMGLAKRDVLVAAMKPKVVAFAAGAELVPGVVTAVDIQGHTPGHSGYKITSGTQSILYVGDSMHHFVISVRKPDWLVSFDADQAKGAKSRAKLIADAAASGQRIFSVHFPFPGIGRFEKKDDGYAWVAE
jgi:glyoxylase-like metal-dependent hydrolase (beta-lactamase superfamily II)